MKVKGGKKYPKKILTKESWSSYTNIRENMRVFLVTNRVKNLPAMQGTWIQSLGQEDPLEKEMAIHSSALAWRSLWTEEPGGLQSMGLQRVRHNWETNTFTFISDKIAFSQGPK